MRYTGRMVSFMVFVFGLAIGSFLSAFVYRLERGESALHGRSYCPQCKHSLAWYDLVPLLSFLFLRGRCRYCKKSISLQDPLIELATGVLFVAVFWFSIPWLDQGVENLMRLSFTWAIGAILLAVFAYDFKHFLIPDILVYSAIGLTALWRVFEFLNVGNFETLASALIAGFAAAAFFLAIYLVSRGRWMGFGDVKLAFLLGLFLEWPSILVALFSAFSLGAIVGLYLIALKKKGFKSEVPFAPFLIIGTAIAFFFGSRILSWYLGLFLV